MTEPVVLRHRRPLLFFVLFAIIAAVFAWRQGWIPLPHKGTVAHVSGEAFSVLDASERSLDGHPAIAILFSSELDAGLNYDRFLTVFRTQTKEGKEQGKPEESRQMTGGWVMSPDHHLLYFPAVDPETSYEVKVAGDLRDAGGRTLGTGQSYKVSTRKVTPAYGFATSGAVLPSRLSEGLPIVTINVPEVNIEFLRVRKDSLGAFMNNFYWQSRTYASQLEQMSQYTESVYSGRFSVRADDNTRTLTNIPVHSIEALRPPGLYVAVMTRPGHFEYQYQTAYYFVTDIGLSARRYENRLEIYASSLETGQPIDDVEIRLIDKAGKELARDASDRHGHAQLDIALKPEQVLIAKKGKDIALLAFNQPALDLSAFSASGPAQHSREVFVYSPRDLYRPGESVPISMLLRDQDGKAVADQPLTLKFQRPDGKVVRQETVSPQAMGYYQTVFDVSDDAPVGQWSLLVYSDPAAKQFVRDFPFKVEDFMPERMRLQLDSQQAWLKPGETLTMSVQGDYLYGAPAGGNKIKSVLNVRPEPHPLPELKDFIFGDVNDANEKRREELPDLSLDDDGHAEIQVSPSKAALNSPLSTRVTVSLLETGGRPVSRTFTRFVWPAGQLVGIRPLFEQDTSPGEGEAKFEIARVSAEGKPAPSSQLQAKLVREDREYYWSYDEQGGWREQFTEQNLTMATESVNVAANAPAKLNLPVDHGRYRLEVFDPQTKLTARYRFYAGWGERDDQTGPDRVMLKLDKPRYKAGDTVKLEILPPHAGSALVLVEADKTLWSQRVDVTEKGRTVDFKIADDWDRHDIYVNVVVFRPGSKSDHITPNRAVGLVHLPLDRDGRKLAPVIESAQKMRPQKPLDVTIKLDQLAGQQAFVTLAAVDVGVLNITRFATPDPFNYFFRQHRFGVDLYDLYGKVIESVDAQRARLRFGGDEDVSADRSKLGRADVKIASLFSGPVEVGKDGRAVVKLDIPDFNGTLRLMAVAYSVDRFGSTESEVVVAAPVVAEAATPRFLAPGDQTLLTLDLHNMTAGTQSLAVKVSATPPLSLDSRQTVELAKNKRQTLRIPLTASEAYGVSKIRLQVEGKSGPEPVNLDREWELSVRPAYPGDRRVLWKQLKPGEEWKLDATLAQGLMPATVDTTLLASDQPPLNLRDAVQGLLMYPYGCAEQTTSAAFPHLYIDEAKARELKIVLPAKPYDRPKLMEQSFARLAGLQTSSGGFAIWPEDSEDPWLTAYVTDFMLQARDQGFAVPEEMLKRALDRLVGRIQQGSDISEGHWTQSPEHFGLAAKAYSAYVLARVQRAPIGTLRTLYDNHARKAESGLPLMQLGLAFVLQGERDVGVEAIKAGIAKVYPDNRYLGDYGSKVRDDALMLALLLRHRDALGDRLPDPGPLVLRLGEELRGHPYLSTQERFAIFLAAQALGVEKSRPWRADVVTGADAESVEVKNQLIRAFKLDELRAGVRLKPRADFPVYAMSDTTGYPLLPPKPRSDVMKITRSYYTLDGKAIGNRALKAGETILVYLQVALTGGEGNQNYWWWEHIDNALVTDLVPAGLEVENLNLTQGETLQDVDIDGMNPQEAMNQWPLRYQEFRDDRYVAALSLDSEGPRSLFYIARVVTPGKFKVPPPFVEDMYKPEMFGIGEAPAEIEVTE